MPPRVCSWLGECPTFLGCRFSEAIADPVLEWLHGRPPADSPASGSPCLSVPPVVNWQPLEPTMTERYATYIRASTDEQEDQHQRDDIEEWLAERDLTFADVDIYAEHASGADEAREEFQRLIAAIENGGIDHVVVWEISRIARRGFLAQKFFDACEDNDTVIHVVNGSVRRVEPDGHGRMVADVIAAVAAEERRQLVRRTKAGLRRAKSEGKWLGQVPTGFVRDSAGYLRPNLAPDYDAAETGYLDVADALQAVEGGESYRSAAEQLPNCSRQTLMNIDKDDERRRWYLDAEADEEVVQEALDGVALEPNQRNGDL